MTPSDTGVPPEAARFAEVLDALAGDLSEAEVRARIDRLARQLAAGRGGLSDAADAAALRHLDASAGRVREVLRQAHRRQAEIAALYATARDLAAVRDLDEVLLAIVRRAQELMPSADAAYMVTRDVEHGGFRMRASVGLVSPAFKNVHVPPGAGMSARIEQTRSAYWTRDYRSNTSIRHDSLLDRALSEDGLASVLGTPLLVRSEVVGVLFAANRVERSYSKEEIAALSAFADHAGVAMENARLFAELETAHAAAAADLASMEHSAALHDALADLVIRGGDAAEVVEVLADSFDGVAAVTDRDGRVTVARGDGAAAGWGAWESGLAAQVQDSSRGHRPTVEPLGAALDVDAAWRHVAAVGSGSTQLGAVVLVLARQLDARGLRSLERAAQIVTLLALRQVAVVEAEERVRGELLAELLGTRGAPPAHTRLRAASRHIDLGAPYVVLAVRVPDEQRITTRSLLLDVAKTMGGLGGEHAGALVAVVPSADPAGTATAVHHRLRRGRAGSVLVCASDPVAIDDGGLQPAAELASRCVRLLQHLGRTNAAATTRSLTMYGILFDGARAEDLRNYVQDRLGELAEHDRQTGSELLKTLSVYFAEDTNTARTARALFVHNNTIVKRLDRIAALLGERWHNDSDRLELRVALQLRRLMECDDVQPQGSGSTTAAAPTV